MSGIFGVVSFDGEPVNPNDLARMKSAMAHWGPHGIRVRSASAAAAGCCQLINTPEALHEHGPYLSIDGDCLVVAEARLDNRSELFDRLEVPSGLRLEMPDGQLILRAYEQWGEDAARHLLGDWSFSAWHARARQLFLARDHYGNTSLYYVRRGSRLAFASDRKALLALPWTPCRLNELHLAQLLVGWRAFHGPATIYEDILRIPPAHTATVCSRGVSTRRYWRLEDAPDIRFSDPSEYVAGLRHHLQEAVRCRLRSAGAIAVSLSGGLDSGSVASIAARELSVIGQRLLALTAVPAVDVASSRPGEVTNEYALAATVASMYSNIDHIAIPALDVTLINAIERVIDIQGEPILAVGNGYWILSLLDCARRHGATTVLTGQVGNLSISWRGVPTGRVAWSILANGDVRNAILELGRVGRDLAALAYPRRNPPCPRTSGWLINPEFAERVRLKQRMVAGGWAPKAKPFDGRAARLRVLRPDGNLVGGYWAAFGAASGLEVRDPTADIRLMTFALGIPNEHWRLPRARQLIRSAMLGDLPDQVRLNRRHGRQAADLSSRLRQQAGARDMLVRRIAASPRGRSYVDIGSLSTLCRQIDLDLHVPPENAQKLMMGLSTGFFLADQG